MRKYELSISADYVPSWGVTEAVREFFQNSIDEEMRDSSNKMFFDYDYTEQIVRIGNKHSDLDIKTLLFGVTNKANDDAMIGNYGEGYKIATVVLLRLGKTIMFRNYCRREIWKPRLVNSRKYGGVKVPTFFVESVPIWESVPEHSLTIEIGGITQEEYEAIKKSNLHLQEDVERRDADDGAILPEKDFKGKIFVGGLYICTDNNLDYGVDFAPKTVHLERDRSMVYGFDVQWHIARIVEQLEDEEITKQTLNNGYASTYINEYAVPQNIADEIASEFIAKHGIKAAPVSNQSDLDHMKKKGYKAVLVTAAKQKIIMKSSVFEDVQKELEDKKEKERPLYDRLIEFIEIIEEKLTEDEVAKAYELADEVRDIET